MTDETGMEAAPLEEHLVQERGRPAPVPATGQVQASGARGTIATVKRILESPAHRARALQLTRFLVFGALSTALDTLLTAAVYRGTHFMPLAVLSGYLAAMASGYLSHKRFTFGSNRMNRSSMRRYGIASVFMYFVNFGVVSEFKTLVGEDDALVPKLLSIPIVASTSFLVLKFWVFREEDAVASAPTSRRT